MNLRVSASVVLGATHNSKQPMTDLGVSHSHGEPDRACAPAAGESSEFRADIVPTDTMFAEPWWLDAVAPGHWREAIVRRDGRIIARLPYVIRKRFGLTCLGHPPLTQTLGPTFRLPEQKSAKRLSEEKELTTQLIEQLPPFDVFAQTCSPAIRNVLPFYWKGFSNTVRYTYRIDNLQNLDAVWGGFTKECRNTIRKAEKKVVVHAGGNLDNFYQAVSAMWTEQGTVPPFSHAVLKTLDTACQQHSARRLLCAEDAAGNVHAFVYLVWDYRAAYYLVGTSDRRFRDSGAQSLLIWEALKHAASVTRAFDFEGSMNERIEHFFRSFGALQTPLIRVVRTSSKMSILTAFKDMAQAVTRRKLAWFY